MLNQVDPIPIGQFHVEPAFAESTHFDDAWWFRRITLEEGTQWFAWMDSGVEVCRIAIRRGCDWPDHYPLPGPTENEVITIDFFEVAEHVRRRGLGKAAAAGLRAQSPTAILLAYSADADDFWHALGWQRYDAPSLSALFVGAP